MSSIYEQHDAAFSQVSAYIVMRDGKRVATVALKFPRDGAGRLYAYVHILGARMVRGYAGGYGYDKRTAAVLATFERMTADRLDISDENVAMTYGELASSLILERDGQDWNRCFEKAGFDVFQAV